MKWFLYLFSFFLVAGGTACILYTDAIRRTVTDLMAPANSKFLAIGSGIIGFLLLASAASSHYTGFVVFLGLVAILKGVVIFFNPQGVFHRLREWYQRQATEQTFRFFGIIWLILGTALFSWI